LSESPSSSPSEPESNDVPKRSLTEFLNSRSLTHRKSIAQETAELNQLRKMIVDGESTSEILSTMGISQTTYNKYREKLAKQDEKILANDASVRKNLILEIAVMKERLNKIVHKVTEIAEDPETHPAVQMDALKMLGEVSFAMMKLSVQGPAVVKMFAPAIQAAALGKSNIDPLAQFNQPKELPALEAPKSTEDEQPTTTTTENRLQSASERRLRKMMEERGASQLIDAKPDLPLGDDDEIDDEDDPLATVYDGYEPEQPQQGGEQTSQETAEQEASSDKEKESPAEG